MGVILTPMTLLKARMGELSVGLLFSVFSHAPTPNTQKYVCLHIYYYFCFINAQLRYFRDPISSICVTLSTGFVFKNPFQAQINSIKQNWQQP